MKTGDRFLHFKGGSYKLVNVAMGVGAVEYAKYLGFRGSCFDAEDPEREYVVFGNLYNTVVLVPPAYQGDVVIYESEKDGKWWLRTLKNFLEVLPDGRRRFTPNRD